MNSTSADAVLVDIDTLTNTLDGRALPGDTITIEAYESDLADYALLSPAEVSGQAHPLWLLILALRGMGISVDELCEMARKREQDTLLFGNCELKQHRPLTASATYDTTANIGSVFRKSTRAGGLLDFVTVTTAVFDHGQIGHEEPIGEVVSGYIFKRG